MAPANIISRVLIGAEELNRREVLNSGLNLSSIIPLNGSHVIDLLTSQEFSSLATQVRQRYFKVGSGKRFKVRGSWGTYAK